jgi:hypothetical protein
MKKSQFDDHFNRHLKYKSSITKARYGLFEEKIKAENLRLKEWVKSKKLDEIRKHPLAQIRVGTTQSKPFSEINSHKQMSISNTLDKSSNANHQNQTMA